MNNASLELGGDNWAAKDGNLLGYAVGDSSGKYVPNEFTFTRGSNLSATRINEQGYIEKGYENLLLQSNSFDTTWTTSNASVTGGQAGYDGSSDAWKIESISDGVNRRLFQSLSSSGVQTYSVYAKAGSVDFILLQATGGAGQFFNLSTGTKGNTYGAVPIESKIELVGNGWYRCSITFSGSITQVWIAQSNGTTTTAAGDNIYIQDAMLNQGLVAYPYIETTAASVGAGVLENEPRIDYSSGTASLLLEPQRTNLITYSEYITSVNNGSTSYNATESPEGLLNAPIFTATSADPFVRSANFSITTGDTYTMSFYIKGFGTSIGKTCGASATTLGGTTFTLTGSWQRISYSEVSTSTRTNAQLRVDAPNVGAVVGEQFSVWGMQVEQASYPTSYIPTYGVSQTRLRDEATLPSIQTLSNDYTIFLNIVRTNDDDDNQNFMRMGDSTTGGEILFLTRNSGRFRMRVEDNAGNAANFYSPNNAFLQGDISKIAIKSTGNGFYVFINGVLENSNTSLGNTTLSEITYLKENVNVNQLTLLPTALTDSECIELTTI